MLEVIRLAPFLSENDHVHIFGDTLLIVNWINSSSSVPPWKVLHIVNECLWLLGIHKHITFSHCRCSVNKAAHLVSATAAEAKVFGYWTLTSFPAVLLDVLCTTNMTGLK